MAHMHGQSLAVAHANPQFSQESRVHERHRAQTVVSLHYQKLSPTISLPLARSKDGHLTLGSAAGQRRRRIPRVAHPIAGMSETHGLQEGALRQ
jgi:hypothetical protein